MARLSLLQNLILEEEVIDLTSPPVPLSMKWRGGDRGEVVYHFTFATLTIFD
jgi:hypothetical protein